MEKNLNLFFAHVLKGMTLTERQADALFDVLYPKDYSDRRAVTKSTLQQQIDYERWNRQYEHEESLKPKPKEIKTISNDEMDELVKLEYGE